jgi:glycosyltransferase involved in cell wall biosynthesis
MKENKIISINSKPLDQSFGGGNQFLNNLIEFNNKKKKFKIIFDLNNPNIDIILIIDPRKKNRLTSYTVKEIHEYVQKVNNKTLIVQRINECDERKKTKTMNLKLRITNTIADHTIFIASWLKNLNVWNKKNNYSIILNGSNKDIFFDRNLKKDNNKLNIVTHHWSNNYMKGFNIYYKIDELLSNKKWRDKINFTYIGNIQKQNKFKNTNLIKPLNGKDLSIELNKHHIYLTASINEPCGNHQIEGGMCGLPLLYIDSGALPETCNGFGIKFNYSNFEEKLDEIIKYYNEYKIKIKKFNLTSEIMCEKYFNLFEEIISKKNDIIKNRKLNWFSKNLVKYFPL